MSVPAWPGARRRVAAACALAGAVAALAGAAVPPRAPPSRRTSRSANGGRATPPARSAATRSPPSTTADAETAGGYWNDATQHVFPDWVQVSWASAQQVSQGRAAAAGRRPPHRGAADDGESDAAVPGRQRAGRRSERPTASPTRRRTGSRRPPPPATRPARSTSRRVRTTAIRVLYDGGNSDGWSFLEELEAYDATQLGDYDRAADWLRGEATRLEEGSRITAFDGTRIYTPDGTAAYSALWVRDWQYMLEGRPQGVGAADARANFIYLVNRQRSSDGAIPDRVHGERHRRLQRLRQPSRRPTTRSSSSRPRTSTGATAAT